MNEKDFIDAVSTQLADGQIVPFIGAGYSHCAGYPLWSELLQQIIDDPHLFSKIAPEEHKELLDGLQAGHLQKVADYVALELKNDVNSAIKRVFPGSELSHKSNTLRRISEWRCKTIITTNYDDVLEKVHQGANVFTQSFTCKYQRASQQYTE